MVEPLDDAQFISTSEHWEVQEVLKKGQRVAQEHHNTVYHSEDIHPNTVFKIFFRTSANEVKNNIAGAEISSFPESEVVVTDLSEYGFEENATVVAQEQSDYSILEAPNNFHDIEQVYNDAVNLMDDIVEMGMIHNSGRSLSELKLEEFHYFESKLKYVDFEDSNAFKLFPESYSGAPSSLKEVKRDIEFNYKQLAYELSREFGDDFDRVKDIVLEESKHLEYDENLSIKNSIKGYPFQ
jgi:hypothetical protein